MLPFRIFLQVNIDLRSQLNRPRLQDGHGKLNYKLPFATPVIGGVAWCAQVPLQRGGTFCFDFATRSQKRLREPGIPQLPDFMQPFIY